MPRLWIALPLTFRPIDAGRALDHAREHHPPGRGLEPVAKRSDRTRRGLTLLMLALLIPFIALYWLVAGRRGAVPGS